MPNRGRWLALSVAALLLTLLCSSCARSSKQGKFRPVRTPAPKQAVVLAMERQVRNAIDAGEGNAVARQLRWKVTAEPDNSEARLELAAEYQKQGAYELAIDHLRILTDRRPESEDAVQRLSLALQRNEQPLEAIQVLVRFTERQPKASAALLENLAILEDEAGALQEGERFHRRAIAADPQDDKLRNNLGHNFMQQAKFEDAAHEFKAALQLNPASEAARNNLGFAMAGMGKTQEAILHWSSISGPAAAHNNLAATMIENGNLPGARKEIEASLEYDRHNAAAMRNLQIVSELDGKPSSFTISSKESAQAQTGWVQKLGRMLKGNSSNRDSSQNASKSASKR